MVKPAEVGGGSIMATRKRAVPTSPKRGDSAEGSGKVFPFSLFNSTLNNIGRIKSWTHENWHFVIHTKPINGYFLAAKIHFVKSKKQWRVSQVVWLRSRWRAKDQAYKWFCKARKIPFQSKHRVSDKRKERGQQLQQEMQQRKAVDPMADLFAGIQKGEQHDRRPEIASGGAGGSGPPVLGEFFA